MKATLNGTLIEDRGYSASCYFEYGLTTAYGNDTSAAPAICYTGYSFSRTITGLTSGSTYHYRAVAVSVFGTVYGEDVSFTISVSRFSVETISALAYDSGVKLVGALLRDGGVACDCGFSWGVSAYSNTTETSSRRSREGFSNIISGLDRNTEYHYRAFASGGGRIAYGEDKTFILANLPILPVSDSLVLTLEATDILRHFATMNGVLVNDGGRSRIVGLQWGLAPDRLDSFRIVETDVRSIRFFSCLLQDLDPSTTCYYRALAGNQYDYGEVMSFTTLVPLEDEEIEPKPPVPWVPFPPKPDKIAFDFMNVGLVTLGSAGIVLPVIIMASDLPVAIALAIIPGRTSAILEGMITNDTGSVCEAHFRWRKYGLAEWRVTELRGGLRKGNHFRKEIQWLMPGTKYEFQAQAVSRTQKGRWSKAVTFTTSR